MIYSYTQISQYLVCPRRYRHRYLDGWQEKDGRAAMLFGRAFERALAAFFLRQDASAVLFQEWKPCQDQKLEYSHGDTWDRMLEQGIQLLDRFCQDDRVRRIESAQFLPHSGIRFPQNPCRSCPYLGLCLGKKDLVATTLVRRPGVEDFGWLDELSY